MPLKAVLVVNILAPTITLGLLGMKSNTSIAKTSNKSVEQYKEIITQLIENQLILKEQLNR